MHIHTTEAAKEKPMYFIAKFSTTYVFDIPDYFRTRKGNGASYELAFLVTVLFFLTSQVV